MDQAKGLRPSFWKREREGRGWSGRWGQLSSGDYGNEILGALCGGWGEGQPLGGEWPVWNLLPPPAPAAVREPRAPHSLPDITNCLVTFPTL